MVEIDNVAKWIAMALESPVPEVAEYCGDYYSPYYSFFLNASLWSDGLLSVELGCDNGRGLMCLAVCNNGQVIGVDHTRKNGINKAQKTLKNIIFLQQDSLPVPEWFDNQDEKISLLHIDTEHSYSQAKAEFEAYQPYLANPAIVIFDDLHAQEDSVLKYFMELPYPKIQDDRMHPVCGWGVVLYV